MKKILEVKNIAKTFNTLKGEIDAIKDISFDVYEGEYIAIVGTSGCGKSSLLSILAGLDTQTSGIYKFSPAFPVIGYMLQDDALLPYLTIEENIYLGLKLLKLNDKKYRDIGTTLLKKYNLEKFKDKYPNELSGGMKQRVALIRTLAIDPDILFLDEPFSALDYTTRLNVSDDVYKTIKTLNKTSIMVTHDIAEAVSMADKVIVLSKGPSVVKKVYEITLDKKKSPKDRRKEKEFLDYYEKILEDLD